MLSRFHHLNSIQMRPAQRLFHILTRSLIRTWFTCVVFACVASSSLANETTSGEVGPTLTGVLQRFRRLSAEAQNLIIERYALIRYHNRDDGPPKILRPARYYLNCGRLPCNAQVVTTMRELRFMFPHLIGDQAFDPASANIEIYAMAFDVPFAARAHEVDDALKSDAAFSAKHVSCRNYLFHSQGVVLKSLIFVNSSAPAEYLSSCITLELGRSLGSFGLTERPLHFMHDKRHWLAAKSLAILQIYLDQDESLNAYSARDVKSAVMEKYFANQTP